MPKLENTIIGIQGYKGDGKTTLATVFPYAEYENNNDSLIFSNYKLNFPSKFLNAYDMLVKPDIFKNATVIIDELHEYADSRNSSSFQNIYVSAFFLQSRHNPTDIIWTSQFADQIDKRIKRITDINIMIKNLHIDSDHDGDDDLFSFVTYDKRYDSFTDDKILYAKPIFSLFDSGSRINPFLISKEKKKELLQTIEKLNEEKLNTT